MRIDLTPVFQAIIALLAALVTYKLIPWIKSKTDEQQQNNLRAAAQIAVFAAEQIYGAAKGDEKLDYAIAALEKAGFYIDKSLAREAIEEAVRDMNNDPREMLAALAGAAEEDEDGNGEPEAAEDEEPEEEPQTEPELRDWQKECPQPFEACAQPIEELAEDSPGDTEAPPDAGQDE